jgi:hypothetical protein
VSASSFRRKNEKKESESQEDGAPENIATGFLSRRRRDARLSVWFSRTDADSMTGQVAVFVRAGRGRASTHPTSHPSQRIMESSCAEPPQFWHPKVSSCSATSSRPCAEETRRREGKGMGQRRLRSVERANRRAGGGRGMRKTRHASRARRRAADACVCPAATCLSRRRTPRATRSDARHATRRRACRSREKKKKTRGDRGSSDARAPSRA